MWWSVLAVIVVDAGYGGGAIGFLYVYSVNRCSVWFCDFFFFKQKTAYEIHR